MIRSANGLISGPSLRMTLCKRVNVSNEQANKGNQDTYNDNATKVALQFVPVWAIVRA